MISNYLREQLSRHPAMAPGDVMKWCFQASFGAEHLMRDREGAWKYLTAEYEALEMSEDPSEEPLYECISDTLCRVNLRPWKASGLPLEWLFTMFAKGAAEAAEKNGGVMEAAQSDFPAAVKGAEKLIGEGLFGFSMEEWQRYLGAYPMDKPVAVHHSEKYREREMPAYRLVPRNYIRILPILNRLWHETGGWMNGSAESAKESCEQVYVVAIDGRCASGKTTMAALLAEITGAGVVHMDDFFLPMELRTAERLNEPGGNVHYERMLEEVIPNLKQGDAFSYGRFDCSRMAIADERIVAAGPIRIVEGAYSCHPKLGEYMNLKVFSDVEADEQLARIAVRDGEKALKSYRERWIPMEEKYLEAYQIKDRADVEVS